MKDVKKYSVKWTHWDSNRECLKFDKVSKPSSSTIITTYEIQLLIKNLKMKSNSSPNDIPYKFLKIANCIVSEWLSKLFNKCMTTGEFPDSWKIATITPIPKVHSPGSPSEYRPISVLPVLSKLFENVLYHRVYSYLTEHNLITCPCSISLLKAFWSDCFLVLTDLLSFFEWLHTLRSVLLAFRVSTILFFFIYFYLFVYSRHEVYSMNIHTLQNAG